MIHIKIMTGMKKKELADLQSMLPLEDDKEEFVAMPMIPPL